eukprot:209424-Pelagomonas_calceolata.AAC.2
MAHQWPLYGWLAPEQGQPYVSMQQGLRTSAISTQTSARAIKTSTYCSSAIRIDYIDRGPRITLISTNQAQREPTKALPSQPSTSTKQSKHFYLNQSNTSTNPPIIP